MFMRKVCVGENLSSIEDIHKLLNECQKVTRKLFGDNHLFIDLSDLKYITPIGFTALLSIFEYLEKEYEIKIKVPIVTNRNKSVIGYMERMNFFKYCNPNIVSQFEEQTDMDYYYSRNRNNKENDLLEIKRASSYEDVEVINSSLKKYLRIKVLPVIDFQIYSPLLLSLEIM